MTIRVVGFLAVLGMALNLCGAAEPVGWRMNGASAYPDAAPPLVWSKTNNVIWKTKLPQQSNASPIILGKRLFVCAETNTLLCIDKESGAILWQKENPSPEPPSTNGLPATHKTNGYATPTPVSDGTTVYVLFGTGVAAAYDLDGNRKWIAFLASSRNGWGHSSSPLLVDGKLFVTVENTAMALSLADGSVLWKTNGIHGWGSPVLLRADKKSLVFNSGGWVYSMADGAVLAKLPRMEYNSALAADGVLYCIQAKSKAYAVRDAVGTDSPLKEIWNTALAADRYYASPVIHNGLIYDATQKGVFSVLDAKTGERVCEKTLTLGGVLYPSLAVAGDHVFLSSDNGKTVVFKAGRDPAPVATNSLEIFRSIPVFEGKRIYIRGYENLYCIGADAR